MREYTKPVERTFTAAERDRVTILFGGLTWKHEEMIKAVFHGSGYHCENIPTPVVADFQAGKEYGNNGQCNPTYFTVGNLVRYLQGLEKQGLSRQEISTTMSSSLPVRADRAASVCTRRSTASLCTIPCPVPSMLRPTRSGSAKVVTPLPPA